MTENKETVVEKKEPEYQRGVRGNIGTTTAALTIKQMYHAAHFKRVDAEDKRNPNKKVWVKNTGAPSLKMFARKLVAAGDLNAKDFFSHKSGSLNAKRSDVNAKAAAEARLATKSAKHKTGKK